MDQEQIERNIAFIIEQQASFWTDIQELQKVDQHTEKRLNRLERLFLLGVGAGRRERRARHELDAKINALIDAQIKWEEFDRQAKQEFGEKMAALDAKLADLAESQAKTEEVIQQTRRETAEVIQQTRRETAELIQQVRREAEVANQESQRRFDQRMDALAAANTQLTAAMAELARALASTSTRVDALSAR